MAHPVREKTKELAMAREPRVFLEGGIYHIYCRVTRCEPVFMDPRSAEVWIAGLSRVKQRDDFILFAWALMANHYHLLVRTLNVPLWRSMASLQVSFSKRFNRHRGFVGPFWQSRYQAKLVEDQRYFDQLLAYIHLNPVSAGVVSDPSAYPYSGHRQIIGVTKQGMVDVDEVLAGFGGTRDVARRRYLSALKGARLEEWLGEVPGSLPWWGGSESETSEKENPEPRSDIPVVDVLGRSTGLDRPELSVRTLVAHGCSRLGVDIEDVSGPGRERELVRAREAITIVGVERYCIRQTDIAALLGRGQDTVSRWLRRAAARRGDDGDFADLIQDLDRSLATLPPEPIMTTVET
jgi:REP element-mobilizing transposase RayT